jgi:hypothetical protein
VIKIPSLFEASFFEAVLRSIFHLPLRRRAVRPRARHRFAPIRRFLVLSVF